MKPIIAAALLAVLAAGPALAQADQSASKPRKDPEEVICKVRQTTASIPRKYCATRREWQRENERTRQDMMLSQKGFCGRGSGC
jgi:hypothetical protein